MIFWDALEDLLTVENMDDLDDTFLPSAIASTERDQHPNLFRSVGSIQTITHPGALEHFTRFAHTQTVIVNAKIWKTDFGEEFEVLDRDYMGVDLGELLTYSAVVMNPSKGPGIHCHSRSQGYLSEPLKRY